MIHIITAANRPLYHHALMEMHRQRKALFIDQLGWPLRAEAGLEIDDYDSPEAIYLIEAQGPRAPVTASARLLRTDRPHLLGDVFPQLCGGRAPTGPHIWEATRFCPAPEGGRGEARRAALARMIAAIIEAGLLFGIEKVTFVASGALAPLAEKAGWRTRALGPRQGSGVEALAAMEAEIDAAGLRRVRDLHGFKHNAPLTRFYTTEDARAA